MAKKMLIDATHPEETRVVVVDGNRVEEFDYESVNKLQIAGNIYLAKVTRVEPALHAAFVDYGGNRHGFLAFAEIHSDYYQIPIADREALAAAERAEAARLARLEASDDSTDSTNQSENGDRRGARKRARRRGGRSNEPKVALTPLASAPAPDAATIEAAQSGNVVHARPIDLDAAAIPEADPDTPFAAEPPADETPDLSDVEEVRIRRAASEEEFAATGETVVVETIHVGGDVLAEHTGAPDSEIIVSDPITDPTSAADDDVSANEAQEAVLDEPGDEDPSDADDEEREQGRGRRSRRRRDRDASGRGRDADPNGDDDGVEERANGIEEAGADDIRDEFRPRAPKMRDYKIHEVIKRRQILLVQVVKEERGTKGAALTTYLSLAGRYCVLMPNTARGGGISRKITNAQDRKRLKAVAQDLDVPEGMGLIIRTAGANRTKVEIKRDYEYLLRQWAAIRDLTLKSVAPTLIYEEGSLIKRAIRDLYNRDIDTVQVEGEEGYREAKDYMKMLMPSHARHVQLYRDQTPLFIKHQVETQMNSMFDPTVQLRSGGYLVIHVTEALIAIDVNSGRSTKESSIEETALKTNLEAAEEAALQFKLRDLAGLIVIDFIDMEDPKNNRAVEKRLKDRLKTDRARIQLGRISGFGLLEMSRQRLRPGLLEATTIGCPHCKGSGLIRSDESMALSILRAIEEEGVRKRAEAVRVAAPVPVANYLVNHKRARIAQIEARYDMQVFIDGASELRSPDFSVERVAAVARDDGPPSIAVQIEAGFAENAVEIDNDEETGAQSDPTSIRDRAGDRSSPAAEAEGDDVGQTASTETADDDDENGGRKRRRRRGGKRKRRGDRGEDGSDPLPIIDLNDDAAASEHDAAAHENDAARDGDTETQAEDARAREIEIGDEGVSASEPGIELDEAAELAKTMSNDAPAADHGPPEDGEPEDDQAASSPELTVVAGNPASPQREPRTPVEPADPQKPRRSGWWAARRPRQDKEGAGGR